MKKSSWEKLFTEAISSLRKQTFVPYRTGNLKYNAIKGIWVSDKTFRIYIDEEVAPYVYFTNEVWQNRKWNNPHQGWVNTMVEYISEYIARKLGGKIQR